MNIQQIKSIAKETGVKSGKLNKTELIQAIQCAEGNQPCYGTGKAVHCGQSSCLWKDDCK